MTVVTLAYKKEYHVIHVTNHLHIAVYFYSPHFHTDHFSPSDGSPLRATRQIDRNEI